MDKMTCKHDDMLLELTHFNGTAENPTAYCIEIWTWDEHMLDYVDGDVFHNFVALNPVVLTRKFNEAVRELVYGTIERPY